MRTPILCDESIFELLAQGDFGPYRKLIRLHFARLAALYILAETIEYLTLEKRIDLPLNVFAPFRLLVPDHIAIRRANELAVFRSIPLQRALIVELANHYLMQVALTNDKNYLRLGLPWERRYPLLSRLGYNNRNVALRAD